MKTFNWKIEQTIAGEWYLLRFYRDGPRFFGLLPGEVRCHAWQFSTEEACLSMMSKQVKKESGSEIKSTNSYSRFGVRDTGW